MEQQSCDDASLALCRTVLPATSVDRVTTCHFTGGTDINVLVAKRCVLEVYRLVEDRDAGKGKLQLVLREQMNGAIESLAVISGGSGSADSIAMSFRDAKMSVVRFDQQRCALALVSLHYFESEKLRRGYTKMLLRPQVLVDPEARCAALFFYDRHIAIVPLQSERDALMLDMEEGASTGSFLITLEEIGVKNVKDIVFLHGFHLPTLGILHEPKQTHSGRLPILDATSVLTAVSINAAAQRYPVVWKVEGLMHDCQRLVAVPRPLGGAMVISANVLLHLSQSAKFALRLNDFADITAFSLPWKMVQSPVTLQLDGCHYTFLSPSRMFVSLRNGDLYIFHIVSDGRVVRKINISKAGASVLTCDMCTVGDRHVFLGSRVGDSILMRFEQEDREASGGDGNADGGAKGAGDDGLERKRLNDLQDIEQVTELVAGQTRQIDTQAMSMHAALGLDVEKAVDDEQEEDELLFYASAQTQGEAGELDGEGQMQTYSFSISDNLVNLGPVRDMTVGGASIHVRRRQDLTRKELVVTSGDGKNGALCVLSSGIHPLPVVSFDAAGVDGLWAVYDRSVGRNRKRRRGDEDEVKLVEEYHSYLILSIGQRSRVLATADNLEEVSDRVEFSTGDGCVEVGNVGNRKFVVQITTGSAILLQGMKQLQMLAVAPSDNPVLHADISDPYVLLLLRDGTIRLLTFDDVSERLNLSRPVNVNVDAEGNEDESMSIAGSFKAPVTAACLFRDESGYPTLHPQSGTRERTKAGSAASAQLNGNGAHRVETSDGSARATGSDAKLDDLDDDDIYGDSSVFDASTASSEASGASSSSGPRAVSPWHCAVARLNGSLEIYRMPQFHLEFCCRNFRSGPDIVADQNDAVARSFLVPHIPISGALATSTAINKAYDVMEICIHHLGTKNALPVLLARTRCNDILIYHGFHFEGKLRWKRIPQPILSRDPQYSVKTERADQEEIEEGEMLDEDAIRKSDRLPKRTMHFYNQAQRGVFVSGVVPLWICMVRDYPHVYPFLVDRHSASESAERAITAFTHFHNLHCNLGFVLASSKGKVEICELRPLMQLTSPLPAFKLGLRRTGKIITPHQVAFHKEARVYAVSISFLKRITSLPEHETRGLPKYTEQYELRLYSPAYNWEAVDTYAMQDYEYILSVEVVYLRYHVGDVKELRPYVLVGTGLQVGEDLACTGRLLIFEVVIPVSLEGEVTKPYLNFMQDQEEKGPISAVNAVQGLIVMAIGPKILMYKIVGDNELEGYAFFDSELYCVSIRTLKNYVFIADAFHSVALLMWRECQRTLTLMGKDHSKLRATAIEFFSAGHSLRLAVTDENQNLQFFEYAPQRLESNNGVRLLSTSDTRINETTTACVRVKLGQSRSGKAWCALLMGSIDGSVNMTVPVEREDYDILRALQHRMAFVLPHACGLNPRGYRQVKFDGRVPRSKTVQVLDGDLLWRFCSLQREYQDQLAAYIGVSTAAVMQALCGISRSLSIL